MKKAELLKAIRNAKGEIVVDVHGCELWIKVVKKDLIATLNQAWGRLPDDEETDMKLSKHGDSFYFSKDYHI